MQHDLHTCTIIWWLSTFFVKLCTWFGLHMKILNYMKNKQNVQQNLSYWNMFCVGFDIIRVCLFFLISKIPDGCFCAQDFISFWIFHLIYWIKVELCKGPLPALLVQKALVVHYTMTNATQHSNVKKGWFRNFLFWLHEKLEKLKHGLLEKVDEDFLL